MRAVVQRVGWAEVEVDGEVVGRIGKGLLVYVGVGVGDGPEDADWLAGKLAGLRVFTDEEGKLNLSVKDVNGSVLAISNFTLLADARKGRRPAFSAAAAAGQAEPLHEAFLAALRRQGVNVQTGVFGAKMAIRSQADGPVNIIVDSPGSR
ncbi:MAG: D-tyrosyl-tRNA(Tyr) deacylase [Planctomycetales bacterium 4484_123]|nr:MAG: D-tyrosyl-tRNA(Tyr) deacylase [Planctomycetales bacterium 4484_123]